MSDTVFIKRLTEYSLVYHEHAPAGHRWGRTACNRVVVEGPMWVAEMVPITRKRAALIARPCRQCASHR